MSWKNSLLGLSLVLASACGDDDDGSGGPTAQCQSFIQSFCQQASNCLQQDFGQCEAGAEQQLRCNTVVGVGETFDQCLNEVTNASCQDVQATNGQLPNSCNGVLLYQSPEAPPPGEGG